MALAQKKKTTRKMKSLLFYSWFALGNKKIMGTIETIAGSGYPVLNCGWQLTDFASLEGTYLRGLVGGKHLSLL